MKYISKVRIKNFQSHKDTELDLSNGINVCTGSSDTGKSAIIRAILWVITNRPSGDAFRSTWGGDTSVSIKIEDTENPDYTRTIVRSKTNNKNKYTLVNGEKIDEFEGFGRNVPKEIQEILCMDDINIARQHDAPFLLSESSGQVAKTLNEMVDLDLIDSIIGISRSSMRNIDGLLNDAIEEQETTVKTLSSFDELEDELEKIEKAMDKSEEIKEKERRKENQEELLDNLEEQEVRMSWIRDLSALFDDDFDEMVNEDISALSESKRKEEELNSLLEEARGMESATLPDVDSDIAGMEKNIVILETTRKSTSNVDVYKDLLFEHASIIDRIKDINDTLADIKKEVDKIEFCPFCGSSL